MKTIHKITGKIKEYFKANFYAMAFAFKSSRWMYIGSLLLSFFINLIPIASVFVWERTVNGFLEPMREKIFDNAAARYLTVYLLLMIVLVFANHIYDWMKNKMSNIVRHTVEMAKITKMANVSAAYLDDPANRDAVEAASMEGWLLANGSESMINTFSAIITTGASLVVFVHYSPVAGIIFLLTCIPGCIFTYKSEIEMSVFNFDNIKESRQRDYYREILTSSKYAKEVRAYSNADHFISLFDEKLKSLKGKILKLHSKAGLKNLLGNIFTYFSVMFFAVFFTYKTVQGEMLPGTLVLYIGLMISMQEQVRRTLVNNIAEEMSYYVPHILSFKSFLESDNDLADDGKLEFPDAPEITFSHVSFRYPGNDAYVLNDVSFTIKSGMCVALVGLNGAGKSTLIKLIMRIYEPESGEILISGRNIKEYSLRSLRSAFGVCFQQISQYSVSLSESVSIGDVSRPTDEAQVKEALNTVNLSELDAMLDKQLTKRFEEDGIELSGGQWQRLALARAFYGDHKMLILDEPTSALDPIAEDMVFKSFRRLCDGHGGIMISHHLSGVMSVDYIMVLEGGRLIESGSHEELLKLNGHYAMLYNIQAEKFKKGMAEDEK